MEAKWVEDFVSLAGTRSFSRSAQMRHVTQPAFSRRTDMAEGLKARHAKAGALKLWDFLLARNEP